MIMTNPLLQKKISKTEKQEMNEKIAFNNMERPISGYQNARSFFRPFSTKEGGETLMQRRKEL